MLQLFLCLPYRSPDCLQTPAFLNVFSTCRKRRDLDSIKVTLWCVHQVGMRCFLWGWAKEILLGGMRGMKPLSRNATPAL